LELDNVITIRTLSKAYGLAGLRIGYAVASADRIAGLRAYGSPFSVSGVSALIATQALADARPRDSFVREVRRERKELVDHIETLGGTCLPSQANFILARFDDPEWVRRGCASLGVGLRVFSDPPGLERYVRISLPGDPSDYD